MKIPSHAICFAAIGLCTLELCFGASRASAQEAAGGNESAAVLTSWTPYGTATFVSPSDPVLVCTGSEAKPSVAEPDHKLVQSLVEMSDKMLTALSEKSSDADTQYYADGIWHSKSSLPACEAGPAGLAAILWKWRSSHPEGGDENTKAHQEWLRKVAIETFDTAVTKGHNANGRLEKPGTHEVFFYYELANTYLLLKDSLPEETRKRWLDAMRGEVRGLRNSGDIPNPGAPSWKGTDGWYTNGNVDVCHAAWLYLVWLSTGEQEYKDLFELAWKHTLFPSQLRWKGYGFFYFKMPQNPDGSDGMGYITEAAGAPGFDKDYSLLQLSILGRLYLKSRDPRVLRVANLVNNAMLPHLDKTTMVANCLYGSRHSNYTPFATSGVPVLAWFGGREDLVPLLPLQAEKAIPQIYLENALKNQDNPGAYRGYGFDLETTLEAALTAEQERKHE